MCVAFFATLFSSSFDGRVCRMFVGRDARIESLVAANMAEISVLPSVARTPCSAMSRWTLSIFSAAPDARRVHATIAYTRRSSGLGSSFLLRLSDHRVRASGEKKQQTSMETSSKRAGRDLEGRRRRREEGGYLYHQAVMGSAAFNDAADISMEISMARTSRHQL